MQVTCTLTCQCSCVGLSITVHLDIFYADVNHRLRKSVMILAFGHLRETCFFSVVSFITLKEIKKSQVSYQSIEFTVHRSSITMFKIDFFSVISVAVSSRELYPPHTSGGGMRGGTSVILIPD